MISKTIGCRGTLFSDKPICFKSVSCKKLYASEILSLIFHGLPMIKTHIPRCFSERKRCEEVLDYAGASLDPDGRSRFKPWHRGFSMSHW